MKVTPQATLSLLSLLSFATAQGNTFGSLPSCAKACASTLPASCNLDVKCICSDKNYVSDIACCVASKCPASDTEKTLKLAQQLCDTVNIKLQEAPTTCIGSSGSSATESAAASSSSIVASTSEASVASSVSSAASLTSATSAASATSSSSSHSAASASSSASSTSRSASSSSASSSSASASSSNAASVVGGSGNMVGAIGAIAMGAAALL